MGNIINTIFGNLEEKKAYRENEKRAAALPEEYANAYKEIKHYLFSTSGILSAEPLVSLVDLFEEASANDRRVIDITGSDVAAFADALVQGEKTFKDHYRDKLNSKLKK